MGMVPGHLYQEIGRSVFGPLGSYNPEDFKRAVLGYQERHLPVSHKARVRSRDKGTLLRLAKALCDVAPYVPKVTIAEREILAEFVEVAVKANNGDVEAEARLAESCEQAWKIADYFLERANSPEGDAR